MPSPFPGMDPYLEAPNLWPEVHSRLIIAIADSLAPTLLPHYYVAIEQRTYLSTPEEILLIGIPDIVVSKGGDTSASEAEVSPVTTATLDRPGQPRRVTLPETESIQERYLEIREAETHTVVTVLELLSSKNKRYGPVVDVKLLLDGIYDRAGYGIRVNYGAKLVPTLGKRDRQWLEATVRGQE